MSYTSLTLSGNLLIGTGIIHCVFGLVVPPLRDPLIRIGTDGWTTQVVSDINESYRRECAFWFQFGGMMLISYGYLLRNYCVETGKSPPKWLGWYLTVISVLGVTVMPASGFWMVLGQGVWILSGDKVW